MANKKVVKSFLWGALTGIVSGAVTALLFAPKSGRELRGDIAETAQKVGEKTADIGRQAGSAVQSLAKRTSSLVVDAKEATGRLVTDIRSRKSSEPVLETDEVAATEESYDEDKSAAL
ncbi:YtxH domain-containing protein [Cohnella lupini]|uniref:Gas vesicle protein n=1 Tax=Cohnella lupini TaxID=1294267 RepID=A0A3D9IV04_9BACL|nr:YtxH domain-containing protein [Cohnella lupini]RED65562.1 gas vesicle protein [Cohnella lupini]